VVEVDPALLAECHTIMRRHAKSFSRAARFLPRRLHDPVAVLYAFCRIADDSVDLAETPAAARAAADLLIAELDDTCPARPVVRAFKRWVDTRPLARLAAHELVRGIASDVGRVRMDTDADLLRYAYRVAGTVGLMMCSVFGVDDVDAQAFAIDLGIAMQLTNICRDVKEDAANDRVYLPRERLEKVGTSPDALVEGRAAATAIAPVVLDLLALADHYYASAERGMPYLPAEARTAILAASRLYQAIGFELRLIGGDALRGRAVVPRGMKAWHVARALRTAAMIAVDPMPRGEHDHTLHRHLTGLPGIGVRAGG
jgi:phytoene synthase